MLVQDNARPGVKWPGGSRYLAIGLLIAGVLAVAGVFLSPRIGVGALAPYLPYLPYLLLLLAYPLMHVFMHRGYGARQLAKGHANGHENGIQARHDV